MNDAEDPRWRNLLRQYDLATPLAAAEFAALEQRILMQIDALPEPSVPAGILPFLGRTDRKWIMRGACFSAVLFVVLGYAVGRSFDDTSLQTADAASLFASAGGIPWQSFITAPSSTGESDDTAE